MRLWSLFLAECRFEELRLLMQVDQGYLPPPIPSTVFNWAMETGEITDTEYEQAQKWFGYQWDCLYHT